MRKSVIILGVTMFINPISSINKSQNQPTTFGSATRTAIKNKIDRNRLKILLTQDIWAPKLKVKIPESPLEKEVLLEVLRHRLKLDRFTQLTNERFDTKSNIILYNDLAENELDSEKAKTLREKIEAKGPLGKYFHQINHEIKNEKRANTEAMTYFNNINDLEETYLKRKLISENKIEQFYTQVRKNNINVDGRYSTAELIEMIENDKNPLAVEKKPEAERVLSKKQLLGRIQQEYVTALRENFNFYELPLNYEKQMAIIRGNLERKYINTLIRYPEIGKPLAKIYKPIEKFFMSKLHDIYDPNTIKVYSISIGWENMRKIELTIQGVNVEINTLKSKLETDKNNEKLKEALALKEEEVKDLKFNWGKWLEFSVEYEKINRQRMAEAGKEAQYDYLTAENKLIKKYQDLYKTFKENNNSMPESYWNEQ